MENNREKNGKFITLYCKTPCKYRFYIAVYVIDFNKSTYY
jgi:hypothetical protein